MSTAMCAQFGLGEDLQEVVRSFRKEGRSFGTNKILTESHTPEIKELNAVTNTKTSNIQSSALNTIAVPFPITNQHDCNRTCRP